MVETRTVPVQSPDRTDGDNLTHTVCCNENLALCGLDVTHSAWKPWRPFALPEDCVVCEQMPCRDCGTK